jgi:hypothetical protein
MMSREFKKLQDLHERRSTSDRELRDLSADLLRSGNTQGHAEAEARRKALDEAYQQELVLRLRLLASR